MTFDFDQIIDRRGTNALAVEGYQNYLFGTDAESNDSVRLVLPNDGRDLISMWVADMAFAAPPAVTDAIRERLAHPVLGYTMNFDDKFYQAFCDWTARHYSWTFAPQDLFLSTGTVPALYDLAEFACRADEHILTFTPAYGYFQHAADHHNRELKALALHRDGNRYEIDLDALRRAAADPKARMLFLCHPHNPTGQTWTDEQLIGIAEVCLEHDVLIVSDEVHCDLLRQNRTHTPLAKLFPHSEHIVTCMAPSKTFNLAGLMLGTVIIHSEALRKLWRRRVNPICNPLSLAAAHGVYRHGDAWLAELRTYLDHNFEYLAQRLHAELPAAGFQIPNATYMAWIDLSAYFPKDVNLTKFFIEEAGVILEGGEMFIADGGRHVRLNIACPKQTLREAIDRIVQALEK
ncbi:MAG: MalY/PatB family protein [Gammaproteobacteria bacterium]